MVTVRAALSECPCIALQMSKPQPTPQGRHMALQHRVRMGYTRSTAFTTPSFSGLFVTCGHTMPYQQNDISTCISKRAALLGSHYDAPGHKTILSRAWVVCSAALHARVCWAGPVTTHLCVLAPDHLASWRHQAQLTDIDLHNCTLCYDTQLGVHLWTYRAVTSHKHKSCIGEHRAAARSREQLHHEYHALA